MNRKEHTFVALILDYYETYGRHELPWRLTHDPYKILVSELMLQQTQVERVIPKYKAFIKKWPTVEKLAKAQLGEVLVEWQGLGYNRRAKYLHLCAQKIVAEYDGQFPEMQTELESLPGIGPYTAGAILAFAFNQSVTLIETNVRRVFIHHFFADALSVADTDIFPLIEKTVPEGLAREWYAALMDYGSYLKTQIPNPNKKSTKYSVQSVFVGSDRQIRGAVLRLLSDQRLYSKVKITHALASFDTARVEQQLQKLVAENLVQKTGRSYFL